MTGITLSMEKVSAANRLRDLIRPDVFRIEAAMRADVDSLADQVDGLLLEVLRYGLFNGGKRFRPLLAVIASRLSGGAGLDPYRLAIAFEYLHMATLFHDDVIDRADLRRGRPTANHAYGMVAAILAGDFLHARSMMLLGELGGIEALKIFCQATSGMVDGEFLQLRNARNYSQSENDYFSAITGKTALLITATTEIGAIFGGATERKREALKKYGENIGSAFQIIDDLLDYLGDSKLTGKPIGNDLVEGKMTLPLILAMKRANTNDRSRLLEILDDVQLRKECLLEVKEYIYKYDGFSDSRAIAERLIHEALSLLGIFTAAEHAKDRTVLEYLAQYVLTRQK